MHTPLSHMTGEQLLAARVLGTAAGAQISQELDRRARKGLTDSYSAVLETIGSLRAADRPHVEITPLTTAA